MGGADAGGGNAWLPLTCRTAEGAGEYLLAATGGATLFIGGAPTGAGEYRGAAGGALGTRPGLGCKAAYGLTGGGATRPCALVGVWPKGEGCGTPTCAAVGGGGGGAKGLAWGGVAVLCREAGLGFATIGSSSKNFSFGFATAGTLGGGTGKEPKALAVGVTGEVMLELLAGGGTPGGGADGVDVLRRALVVGGRSLGLTTSMGKS